MNRCEVTVRPEGGRPVCPDRLRGWGASKSMFFGPVDSAEKISGKILA
jgi:hypothetical protein